ncbi:hypothetical protein D3C77_733210 [compost metagenome]
MGIGGIGHTTDTGKINAHACGLGCGAHLCLTLTHSLLAPQALAIERFERFAGSGHIR